MRRPGALVLAVLATAQLGVAATTTARGGYPEPPDRTEAVARLERAEDLRAVSAGRLAEAEAREAVLAAEREGDVASEVAALELLAAGLEDQGDRVGAAESLALAESLARESPGPGPQAIVLTYRARGHWRRAEYGPAVAAGERALAFAEQAGDRALQADALLLLGQIEIKRGAYDTAAARLGRALGLAELAGDGRREARAQESLAAAYLDRRLFAAALEHSAAALAIQQRLGSVAGQARALERLAVLYLFQGNLEDALGAAQRALSISEGPGGDPASAALARQARAGALRGLGRHEEAQRELERALALRRELGDPRESAWLLARLGTLEAELGHPAEALTRYREALELWTGLEEWRPVAWYLIEAARAGEKLGKVAVARDFYRSAIELAERIELPYRSVALGGLARLEARGGERAAALLDGRRAVEAAHATANLEMVWVALSDLAEVELAFDLRESALEHLRAALAAIEALRAESVPSDQAKRAESEDRQRVYARTVDLLFDLGMPAEALEVAERARARASLDLFASVGARESTATAAELGRSAAESVPSPRHAAVPPVALLLGEVRSRGLTAIEYFVGEQRLFAWVIGADGSLHAAATPIAPGELESRVRAARQGLEADDLLRAASTDRGIEPASESAGALRALHRLLIEPIAAWLPRDPSRTVTIVPHDRLFLLSFATLRDDAGGYLVEHHPLSYIPSLALLGWTGRPHGRAAHGAPALVVGNPAMPSPGRGAPPLPPLPGAELEARAVATQLGRPAVVLVGVAADELEVRRRAASAPLVHLATHGLLDEGEPLSSLVALAPGGGSGTVAADDGRWTVAEIQEERLVADLVTLSACDTGLGRLSSDGVLGLSRAFLVAGARSVLVSLWRVSDVATRFQMERFYAALAASRGDRAGALRRAQLETLAALRTGALKSLSGQSLPDAPAFWAPFVLVGEPR